MVGKGTAIKPDWNVVGTNENVGVEEGRVVGESDGKSAGALAGDIVGFGVDGARELEGGAVGDLFGLDVGRVEGEKEGEPLGNLVGGEDGGLLGTLDGSKLGADVDGEKDLWILGCPEGCNDGRKTGEEVLIVGVFVFDCEGCKVGIAVILLFFANTDQLSLDKATIIDITSHPRRDDSFHRDTIVDIKRQQKRDCSRLLWVVVASQKRFTNSTRYARRAEHFLSAADIKSLSIVTNTSK
jgi:hypothetical protein